MTMIEECPRRSDTTLRLLGHAEEWVVKVWRALAERNIWAISKFLNLQGFHCHISWEA